MKKIQVMLSSVIILMLLSTSVFAATITGNINLTASDNSVSAGDEFTVTLSLEDISTISGVDSINGYINIDENVIEELTVDNIVTNENGEVEIDSRNVLPLYDALDSEASSSDEGVTFNTNPSSGNGDYRLVIDLANAITADTDLITITFKVRDDVATGTYEDAISYTLFEIYSGSEDKGSVNSQSLDITVEEVNNPGQDEPNEDNPSEDPSDDNNNNSNNDNNNNNNNNNSNNDNQNNNNPGNTPENDANRNEAQNVGGTNGNQVDNTTAEGSLPNAGYRYIILPIILIAIAGFIFYKKYNKYSQF